MENLLKAAWVGLQVVRGVVSENTQGGVARLMETHIWQPPGSDPWRGLNKRTMPSSEISVWEKAVPLALFLDLDN